MLSLLEIKNVALIDSAKIEFSNGLNVLSGETGSGKSVIIESLNFVLGAKADKTLIKNGETECFVRAVFENLNPDVVGNVLSELEIDFEDSIIITRRYTIDGKNTVKINGITVTVSMLKKLTAVLVDVHGQSEHFYLLKESNQLALIDKIGKDDILAVKDEVKEKYTKYKQIKDEIASLGGSEKDRETRLDIINYQIKEIDDLDLKDGEEEELISIKQRLNNLEKIQIALSSVKSALSDDGAVTDIIYNAQKTLSSICSIDEKYDQVYSRLDSVSSDIDDIASSVSNMLDELSDVEYDINYIEDRLDRIKVLKRKYGNSYQEINDFYNSLIEEKTKLENFNDLYEELLVKFNDCQNGLYMSYKQLSDIRRVVASSLAKNVITELNELGITKGKFNIEFNAFPEPNDCSFNSANGVDEVCFMFSANMGQPLKPLSSVISGGEMSRFMLAIKSQTAKHNELSTFIFDEIDAGISGNIAKVVATKFIKISKDVQVIAITHLPQISVMADNNILISKVEDDVSTKTLVKNLSKEDKINEIIRLVGGDVYSKSAMLHARELIDEANKIKKSI